MFDNIIVGVDGSEHAERALHLAAPLAVESGGRITVVHSYDATPPWLGTPNMARYVEAHLSQATLLVDRARALLLELGVDRIETDILEGPPTRAITEAAAVRRADLIVVGSRGMSAMKGLLLGSVSERVIGRAPCPVLVAR